MYKLPQALVNCSPNTFTRNPIDLRAALFMIPDASQTLEILLNGNHSTIAGRLAGAFRNVYRDKIADDILDTMKQTGYDVRENDPFTHKISIGMPQCERSPYVNRIRLVVTDER